MADLNTVRVLCIDGGGSRGLYSATFMQLFCQQWGIDPTKLFQYFDVIAGTSAGAIQALAYALGFTPAQMVTFFLTEAPWIFSTSTVVPSQRPSILSNIATMLLGGSFYDNTGLVSKISQEFGTTTLQQLECSVVIPSYRYDTKGLTLFSNVTFPGSSGANLLASDVALASASAPLYFPQYTFNGGSYMDGGIFLNNPAPHALSAGKVLKPNANRFCVLSVGTGLGDIGFHSEPTPTPPGPDDPPNPPFYQNMYFIKEIPDIAITGAQESNAQQLLIEDEFTLANLNYYRFQSQLDPTQDTGIDNTAPAYFTYLQTAATTQFNSDITDITNFIAKLQA